MPDESIDLVDGNDRVMGASTVKECLEKGLRHRAVAVIVVRSSGLLVLQQRSKGDRWHPGLWTLSSTGHVKAGEPYREAAARELKEELGIESPLQLVGKYLLPPITAGGLTEWEWVALYAASSDEPCVIDRIELEGVQDVNGPRLNKMISSGLLTPDAVRLLEEYYRLRPSTG